MSYSERGLHGQVVHTLGRRIVSGAIEPEQPFDLDALEGDLGVSRTVIRESLKVLAAKGLVDARQKRGTFVRAREDWSLLDTDVLRWHVEETSSSTLFDELAEVRAIVEPAGARLAALRRTEEDLEALAEALEAMASAEDPDDAVGADLRFHRALLAAAHNELLARLEIAIEPALAERDRLVHSKQPSDPAPAHRVVYQAIAAGDPVQAEGAMRALLEQAATDARDHGRTGPGEAKSR